jgi:hypothetical protein
MSSAKFLEYAAKHDPEREMFFFQQLAEFVNKPDRNITLVVALHQSMEAYAHGFSVTQRMEWRKVQGRLARTHLQRANGPADPPCCGAAVKAETGSTKECRCQPLR